MFKPKKSDWSGMSVDQFLALENESLCTPTKQPQMNYHETNFENDTELDVCNDTEIESETPQRTYSTSNLSGK